MTHTRGLILVVVLAAITVGLGAGTAAGQSAPDCSQVSYNGDGSVQNPYEVGNVDQLQCINNQGLSENYTQVSDIDASGTSEWNNESSAVPGGFEPIGNLTEKFNGTFDGSGFTIENLYVNRMLSAFDGTGLFGRTGSGALLEDVGLENAYVNNPSNSSSRVGGLVGFNEGIVNSSYVTGTVSSSGDSVGGLVGLNDRASTILESYSTGDVSARDDSVGGLVGVNQGTVGESYATGNASGSNAVGGLVGNNDPGIVRDSYATGNVSAPSDTGGLVGKNDIGSVKDGYWDMNTTGQNTSEGSATGLDTPEMVGSPAVGNMTGFDFTSTWETVTNPDDYPVLAWQTGDEPAPAFFEVTIDSTNSPVAEGKNLTVTATVTNTGGKQDTQTVTRKLSGLAPPVSTPITLGAGNSTTKTRTVATEAGDAGSYTVNVSSEDDLALATVNVTRDSEGNFTEPLPVPAFAGPPQNIPVSEGGFNDSLVEDLDGDGDATEVGPTVSVFGELIRGNDLGLTDKQARKLNWNSGSPETEVTVADMVTLFGKQIRAE